MSNTYDLQKAGFLKRISARILDFIIITILFTGVLWATSAILPIDKQADIVKDKKAEIEKRYSVEDKYSIEDIIMCGEPTGELGTPENKKSYEKYVNDAFESAKKPENFEGLSTEEKEDYKKRWIEACNEFAYDKAATTANDKANSMILLAIVLSLLVAITISEFIVPVILKNGQTVGKKIFGLGVMRIDGVRLSTMLLFVRTILGKYTIETMVPFFIILMIFNGSLGFIGTLVLFGILILQTVLILTTERRSAIHDLLAQTVVIDYTSQLIFDTPEAMIKYKEERAAARANQTEFQSDFRAFNQEKTDQQNENAFDKDNSVFYKEISDADNSIDKNADYIGMDGDKTKSDITDESKEQ